VEHETRSVNVVNNEPMVVMGATYVTLRVGGRSVESEILITPDQKGLILGIDWLKKHGRFKWDFEKRRIKFGDEDWIELQRERVVLQEERELTPERLCVRQTRIPNTCLRNSQDDTSVLVGESRCSSMERILCSQVFLYYQLLSRAKTCKDRN